MTIKNLQSSQSKIAEFFAEKRRERAEARSLTSWLEGELAVIDEKIGLVFDQAEEEVADFWDFRIFENKKLKDTPNKRSVMGVRAKMNSGKYLSIEWFHNTFYLSGGKWKALSHYIRRGKSYSYSDKALAKHAKEWELERILEAEKVFAHCRKKYAMLSKLRGQLNGLLNECEKFNNEFDDAA